MRVSSAAAAGLVVLALAAQGVTGLVNPIVDLLTVVPQAIAVNGGFLAFFIVSRRDVEMHFITVGF